MRLSVLCLAAIVSIASITGCSSSIEIMKEYKKSDFSTKSVMVRIADDTIGMKYSGSLDNEFGTVNVNDSIKKYLARSIFNNLVKGSKFKKTELDCRKYKSRNINCLFGESHYDTTYYNLKHYEDTLVFPVPCDFSGTNADFTIILKNLLIISRTQVNTVVVGLVPISVVTKPLVIKSDILFWDNTRSNPIAFGKISGHALTGLSVDTLTWRLAVKNFTHKMLLPKPIKQTIIHEAFFPDTLSNVN